MTIYNMRTFGGKPPFQSGSSCNTIPSLSRAAATRRLQQQQQQPVAVTNGRMMVTTSSSLDTPDVSSNDEDDASNASNYSSHSSVHSAHPHDDPASAIVDDTGHLRPVTEDDVFLEMESDSEGDDEKDDDSDDINNEPEERGAQSKPSPATFPKEMIKQRQNAARPPVRTKPARPSRKIQPTEIPRITVVDFGEEGVVDGERGEADSSEVHVDPLVIVENENTEGRAHRPKKFGARKNQKARHTAPSVTNEEGSERDQIHTHSGPGERIKGSSGESASGPLNRSVLKSGAKLTETDETGSGTQSTQGKASKNKFSSILARFQRLDGEG